MEKIKTMGDVAKFCRKRQVFCFQSKAVPQVALLVNTADHYRRISAAGSELFPNDLVWQRPILKRLLQNQLSVEIFTEKNLYPVLQQYPLLVVSEWKYYEPELKSAIVNYVKQGGNLLLMGESLWSIFRPNFAGAEMKSPGVGDMPILLLGFGRGQIAWLSKKVDASLSSDLVGAAVKALSPHFVVDVQGSPDIDISVRTTKGGQLSVHLVNVSGDHEKAGIIESIDHVGPLSIAIRSKKKPDKITIEPRGRPVDFVFENNIVRLTVDSVEIYDIIVVE